MFEKYKKYSDSFLEVVLKEVDRRIDLKLNSSDFNYVRDESYGTYYFKYMVPGNGDINKLISLLKVLKGEGDRYMLLPLPWNETFQKYKTKEESLDELINEFDQIISDEIIENRGAYLAKMKVSNTNDSLPLFFERFLELDAFLNLASDDVEHYFIGTLLLFPLNLEWFMIFDYDLFAIHFIVGDECFSRLREDFKSNEFMYSKTQVEQLIKDAQG